MPINIRSHIRSIPDFPKPGINFYDISTLLRDPDAWQVTMGGWPKLSGLGGRMYWPALSRVVS